MKRFLPILLIVLAGCATQRVSCVTKANALVRSAQAGGWPAGVVVYHPRKSKTLHACVWVLCGTRETYFDVDTRQRIEQPENVWAVFDGEWKKKCND